MSTAAMVRLLLFAGGVGQQRELELGRTTRSDTARVREALLHVGIPWLASRLAEEQPVAIVRTRPAISRLDAMRAEFSSVIVCLRHPAALANLGAAADLLLERGHAWLGEPLALWLVDEREKAVDLLLERVPRYDGEENGTWRSAESDRHYAAGSLLSIINKNKARAEEEDARRKTDIERAQCRALLARLSRMAAEMCEKMRCEILDGTRTTPWMFSYKYLSDGVKPNPSSPKYPAWWYPDELGTESDYPEFMVAWGTHSCSPWDDGPRHSSVIVALRLSSLPDDWSPDLRAAVARPCPAIVPCTPAAWVDKAMAAASVRREYMRKMWPGRDRMWSAAWY